MPMLNNIEVASFKVMFPLVAVTGFLDGIHPCAIAILIFFAAFLLTLQRSLKNIFFLGLVYILVIFLTYLGVGVGLFSGIMFFGQHHFFAKLGAWLLIVLGLWNLKDFFFPQLPGRLRLPHASREKINELLKKASLSTVIVAAFLVGLCSIPCSGGIYAAITALLAAKTTYWVGFAYLLLYNLMFVMPLLIILALAFNPLILVKLGEWQAKNSRSYRLLMGVLMVGLGMGILLFLV